MKIKIPGHGPVTVYSDANTYIEIPGDGPIEIVTPGGPASGGPAYGVVTEATAGAFYVMVDATNYVVTQV
jgi:hypothetical protein